MASRVLQALPEPSGAESVRHFLPMLAAALNGTGPALLPLPADATRAAVLAALRPDEPLEDESVAAVVATSGSTGEPKGVLLSADALLASAAATHARVGGAGAWLLALPPSRIAGLQVLVRSLLAGTEPVPLDPADGRDPEAFAAATERLAGERRYASLVPTQLLRLLEGGQPALAALRRYDAVVIGGSAAPRQLLERAEAAGVRVVTTYGMTEACGGCVYDGEPLDRVSWDLGPDGRIRLSGPVLARGYRLRPDLTRTAFVAGAFVTDDLGRRRDDGRLSVLGRTDDMIVTGGVKVAPVAVEEALLTHPRIAEAAVLGVADPAYGELVVAYLVPTAAGALPELVELRDHVAGRLPRSWAPRELRPLAQLPRLPSGKPDRRALQDDAGGAGDARG